MICSNCGMRWADFPENDFSIDAKGITPKTPEAETRRKEKFDSNKIDCCPDCLDELNLYSSVTLRG